MRFISNSNIADELLDIAGFLEMQFVPFKPRVYEKAAEAVLSFDESIAEKYASHGLKALHEIPGVGVSIAEKIEEFIKTGRIVYKDELQRAAPVDLKSFRNIEGVGPKSIAKLYKSLGIKSAADLLWAAQRGKVRSVPGFGIKTEDNILKSIEFSQKSVRQILGFVIPVIRSIEKRLKEQEGVQEVTVAGSVRRRRETIGDIDILAVSKKPKVIMDYFASMPEVVRIYAKGPTKTLIRISAGIDVDLRVVPRVSYGAALNYFTGSKDHNVALRQMAIKKGYKLNEYGLFKGERRIAGENEIEIYKKLGMEFIEPELREAKGEIEVATGAKKLPKLVGYGEIQGDLQVQTSWTDGSASIFLMARSAAERGLKYIVITDHTKRLAMTHGLDEKRIQAQWKEIDEVNKKMRGIITVLKGTECDILKDGTLDLPDEILAKLDVVGVSVHSFFNLSKSLQTERLEHAISNPHADILFHPTGRIINKREPYEFDFEAVLNTAKKTGTVLEVDSFPDRLDLKDEYVRKCVDVGVKLSIDSDAHAPSHFDFLEYGIAQARRGWAERGDVINAWPVEEMLRFLKSRE